MKKTTSYSHPPTQLQLGSAKPHQAYASLPPYIRGEVRRGRRKTLYSIAIALIIIALSVFSSKSWAIDFKLPELPILELPEPEPLFLPEQPLPEFDPEDPIDLGDQSDDPNFLDLGPSPAEFDEEDPVDLDDGSDDPGFVDSNPSAAQTNEDQETEEEFFDTFIPLERLYGRWIAKKPEFTFAILPREGAFKRKGQIQAHTARRIWKGTYEGRPGEPLVAEFFYLPTADEMDPEIPAWARAKVDGELEWHLQLFAKGPDHHPYLEAQWHRKEVKWEDDSKKVDIIEDGEPLKFDLHYAPIMKITQAAPMTIGIFPIEDENSKKAKSSGLLKKKGALASVLQQQNFKVELSGPFRLIKELGQTVTVEFEGETSGQKTSLTLEARVKSGDIGRRVTYTHDKPVKLAICGTEAQYYPPTMSLSWMAGLKAEGSCLPFKGSDGEIIKVSYGNKIKYRFQWWRHWMNAALAAHRDEIEQRREGYSKMLANAKLSRDIRDTARNKIQMIRNYDALMRSDRLANQHKVAIGDIYLGGKGAGSYVTYAGATYGNTASPTKGLLSYTDKNFSSLESRAVRWQRFEPGMYAESLAVFTGIFQWFASLGFNDTPNENIGERASESIPGFFDRTNPTENVDPNLRRDIVWTNRSESAAVHVAVRAVSSGLVNDLSESFFKQVTFALYDITVGLADADFLFIVADWVVENAPEIMQGLEEGKWPQLGPARNHRGQPVDGWGFAQEASLSLLGFAVDIDKAVSGYSTLRFLSKHPPGSTHALKNALPWRSQIGSIESGEILVTVAQKSDGVSSSLKKGDILPADIPKNVTPDAQNLLAVEFKPAKLKPDKQPSVKASASGSGDVTTTPKQVEVAIPVENAKALKKAKPPSPQIPTSADVTYEYGNTATLQSDIGAVLPPQQAKYTDGVIAANYAIAKEGTALQPEMIGAASMQNVLANAVGRREMAPAGVYYFGHNAPYPDEYLNQFMASRGLQGAEFAGSNKKARMIHAYWAQEKGWTVTARLDIPGDYPRQVVIDKITLGQNYAPEKIVFFDPKYGTRIEMDARDFDALLARNHNESVFKATRKTDPDNLTGTRKDGQNPLLSGNNADPDDLTGTRSTGRNPALPAGNNAAKAASGADDPIPAQGQDFIFKDTVTGEEIVVPLGDLLGEGSFSIAFKHGDKNFRKDGQIVVVRINHHHKKIAKSSIGPQAELDIAQTLDDAGRMGLNSGVDSDKIQVLTVFGQTTMPNGRRVELVAFAKGTPAHKVLKKRAGKAMSQKELDDLAYFNKHLEDADEFPLDGKAFAAGKKLKEKFIRASKFTPAEAKAVADAMHELNKKGYIALDLHNHNFNFIYDGAGGVKLEIVDPGGIVPVKNLDPKLARQAQLKLLDRDVDDVEFFRKNSYQMRWDLERNDTMDNIKDAIDFQSFKNAQTLRTPNSFISENQLPFKPSIGFENPEVTEFFRKLKIPS